MTVQISSGHNVVYDDGSCIPGWSLYGLTDTHFHVPSACLCLCLCLCPASVAVHAGPLSNLVHLPTHDLCLHDDPCT